MAQEYLEDRIHKEGKHDEFRAAHDKFSKSKRSNTDQSIFYDKLVELGAGDEEADEFVNTVMDS